MIRWICVLAVATLPTVGLAEQSLDDRLLFAGLMELCAPELGPSYQVLADTAWGDISEAAMTVRPDLSESELRAQLALRAADASPIAAMMLCGMAGVARQDTAAPAPALDPASGQMPPMTGSEREAMREAISGCWAVDPGSEAAMVQLTVAFELDREGRVVGNDVRRIAASGGSDAAMQEAFHNARRAILRCQGQDGYQLPPDKFDQWQHVEMTFDSAGLRMR